MPPLPRGLSQRTAMIGAIQGVNLPKSKLFKYTYTPKYEGVLLRDQWIFAQELAMAKANVLDRHREKRGLWLKIIVMTPQKPIVRNKIKQWCRGAWFKALADRGFDSRGIALKATEPEITEGDLRGTLRIEARTPAILDMPRERIEEEMHTMADALVAYNRGGKEPQSAFTSSNDFQKKGRNSWSSSRRM